MAGRHTTRPVAAGRWLQAGVGLAACLSAVCSCHSCPSHRYGLAITAAAARKPHVSHRWGVRLKF